MVPSPAPATAKDRHNGWKPEFQLAFVEALAETGSDYGEDYGERLR